VTVSRLIALVLLLATLTACASADVVGPPEAPGQIAGTWQGYLMGQKGFFLLTMVIQPDGAVSITGESFISASGKVTLVDGRLWLDATAGWYGPLVLMERDGQRFLRIDRYDKQYPGRLRFVSVSAL